MTRTQPSLSVCVLDGVVGQEGLPHADVLAPDVLGILLPLLFVVCLCIHADCALCAHSLSKVAELGQQVKSSETRFSLLELEHLNNKVRCVWRFFLVSVLCSVTDVVSH